MRSASAHALVALALLADGSAALQLGMRDYSAHGTNTVSRRGLLGTAAAAAAFGLSLPSQADESISPAKAKVSGRTP